MTKRTSLAALTAALLLLAACGTPQVGEGSTTTDDTAVTTTSASASTTIPVPPSTTTTPTTTTTEATAHDDAASLFASLSEANSITSARIEGAIEMTGLDVSSSGISEATIVFSTAFDTETGDSSFMIDMSSMMDELAAESGDQFSDLVAGMLGNIEVRQIGETVYMKYPFLTSMFGAETEWVSMPAEEGEEFAGDFDTMPTDPAELIDSFDDAGAAVETVGTEEVNGVQATHYRINLDTDEMELTPEEEAELAASGIWAEGVIPMEIWVSEAGYMVRMIMEIDGTGIDAPPEEEFDTMYLRYDVFDINEGVAIEAPPASDVTSMEELESSFGLDN